MAPDFVAIARACATGEEFESRVLATLERHVGCDVAFFSVKGREARPSTRGLDQRVVEQAVRGGSVYEAELGPVKAAALGARGVAVDTEVLGESAVRRTRYFHEVASMVSGRHSLFALLCWQGRPMGSVMLGRCGKTFSASDVSFVEAALPALALGRAAFGWPYQVEPLRVAERSLAQRLGLSTSAVRARIQASGGELVVRDRGEFREMLASRGDRALVWTRAALDDAARSGFPYVDLLHLAAALARGRDRALFIGCGGGVAVRQFAARYPGIAIDVVEREPAVVELARDWFGLDTLPGVSVHVADGHDFVLGAARSRYDIAVVDAYDAEGVANDLVGAPFFRALARAIHPWGAAAFNVIGTLAGDGVTRAVERAASSAFEAVRVVPVLGRKEAYAPETLRNIVIVASQPQHHGA
jgi:spermidine synthase